MVALTGLLVAYADSGHGSQVKDTDGDEIDGYDEGRRLSTITSTHSTEVEFHSDLPCGLQADRAYLGRLDAQHSGTHFVWSSESPLF